MKDTPLGIISDPTPTTLAYVASYQRRKMQAAAAIEARKIAEQAAEEERKAREQAAKWQKPYRPFAQALPAVCDKFRAWHAEASHQANSGRRLDGRFISRNAREQASKLEVMGFVGK